MRIEAGKWCVILTCGIYFLGAGWWTRSHWKRASGWICLERSYYDGNWLLVRVGPFFFCKGPY